MHFQDFYAFLTYAFIGFQKYRLAKYIPEAGKDGKPFLWIYISVP
jgi:hypothetical protein